MKLGAKRLREYIKAAKKQKITQIMLAESIGCSRPYLHDLVNGRTNPSLDMAIRIETVTGVKFKDWGVEI